MSSVQTQFSTLFVWNTVVGTGDGGTGDGDGGTGDGGTSDSA